MTGRRQWLPWLRTLVLVAGGLCAAGILLSLMLRSRGRRLLVPIVLAGVIACARRAGGLRRRHGDDRPHRVDPGRRSRTPAPASAAGGGGPAGGAAASPVAAVAFPGGTRWLPRRSAVASPAEARRLRRARRGPAAGGGPGQITVSAALRRELESGASRYRWVAATSGSQSAASLELATGGNPVMAIGGFDNEGGNISPGGIRAVRRPRRDPLLHRLRRRCGIGPAPAASSTSAITTWVEQHFKHGDDRRSDGLRPDPAAQLINAAEPVRASGAASAGDY